MVTKKNKIIFHFVNGGKYEVIGYREILIDYLKSKEDYLPIEIGLYVMKNNINYIKIEDIEKESEEE